MPRCQCQGIEIEFNRKAAAAQLKRYRARGPAVTTRMLIDALKAVGVEGMTLLDIGGGIGAIQHELLKAGVVQATGIEASIAFVNAATEEATRMGHADRIRLLHGDFVKLAPEIPPADIVTLDRVICCYPNMPSLVGQSAARARGFYSVVYPRSIWWNRVGLTFLNFVRRLQGNPFRVFAHRAEDVDALIRENGLTPRFHRQTFVWRVDIYSRPSSTTPTVGLVLP